MALQMTHTSRTYGITSEQAYARISSFYGNADIVHFILSVYASREARDNQQEPLEEFPFHAPFPLSSGENLLTRLYTELKSQSRFETAEDV
ncbi:hypothetical protein [Magnetococcus sp. PR-3]|uniref:hypothetical protein n=1 Tax=Magnetococcus sp. PR-3 TaxID=3120355 RepID=UPI002FCDF869